MNTALLTIDDFPSSNTPVLFDYLKGKGVAPIFFAVGQNVEQHYEEAMYAVKNGAIVGNHSYSHPGFSTLTFEECTAEIEACEDVLDRLYNDCGIQRRYRPFRFPYGDKGGANKAALQRYLREKGFHKVDDSGIHYPWWHEYHLDTDVDTFWTFDFEEYRLWQDPDFTQDSIWRKMNDKAPEQGAVLFGENHHHLILMHDFAQTEQVMPGYYRQLVEYLEANGMEFVEPGFLDK